MEEFSEEDLIQIDWYIDRLKNKRQEIDQGIKSRERKINYLHDSTYDIRELKPYKHYINRLEKDMYAEQQAQQKD